MQQYSTGDRLFAEMMAQLTPIQMKAVLWDEGPLLILAGPGSGKTRVLTCRIARLLKATEQKKFRVLGLTFTNKAADEMRDRVSQILPDIGERLFLGTFHSFCADVLRQHGVHMSIKPDFRIYSNDSDRKEIIIDAIRHAQADSPEVLESDHRLLALIDRLRANLISPEQSEQRIIDPTQRKKVRIVYEAYDRELRSRNALDFNSLIYYTCQLFRQYPTFAKRYRTVYPYWCVDEFQDTNLAQYELLRLMANPDFRNVFVVADDDQIIYQWNGASHQRVEIFQNEFNALVIQLPTNYRCPSEIVELANNLIANNSLRHSEKQPLTAAKPPKANPGEAFELKHYESQDAEAHGIVETIQKFHLSGLSKIVVLARTRRLLEGLLGKFAALGIKAVISQRRDEFVSSQFIWLHSTLRQSISRSDEKNFRALSDSFSFLTGVFLDCDAIIASAKAKHGDYLREWVDVLQRDESTEVVRLGKEVSAKLLQSSDFKGFVKIAVPWLDSTQVGVNNQSQASVDYEEDKLAWSEIYQQVLHALGAEPTLDSFLQELAMRSKEPPSQNDSVTLMTIHAAKGKEFDQVFLMGLAEEILPSFQSINKGDNSPEMEEERRNCYVALTRTSKMLSLSYADSYYGWKKKPSRFLSEMGIL